MTIDLILSSLKTLWEKWNIRGIVILSLSLQAILILFAPMRKRSANPRLIFSVWLAYLLADWAAAFAVGLISYRQMNDKSTPADDGALVTFWAPFLLVHLGGPDTITAFSLEDNALWLRHLFNLIFQVSATIYNFYQTFPKNNLWMPTLLMLFAGLIKYAERTRALYLASLKRFKESMLEEPDPGPNYAKLMDEYSSLKDTGLPSSTMIIPVPSRESKIMNYDFKDGDLDEAEVVQYGYVFFETFKGLIVNLIFTFHERSKCREVFQKRTAADALKVISVELNFIYEVLYTKVLVVHSKWGYIFRAVSSTIVVVTLVLFTRLKTHQYHIFDRIITYALLYGAIGLDITALLMLIFSDWSVATFMRAIIMRALIKRATIVRALIKRAPILEKHLARYVSFTRRRKPDITTCHIEPTAKYKGPLTEPPVRYEVFDTKIWFRRWSESICAYNLLSVCLKLRPRKILKDKQKSQWCTVLVIIASIPLIIPGAVVHCFGLTGWSILGCCNWLIKAVSTCLKILVDYFLDKLSLREVLDGLKPKSVLSYVWSKHANEDCNAKGCCGNIISKLCEFPSYIIRSTRDYLDITTEAIDNGLIWKGWDTLVSFTAKKFGFDEFLDSMKYVSRNPFLTKLWDFIHDELQLKSVFAEDTKTAKLIYEAKGDWVLQVGEWLGDLKEIKEHVRGDYDGILLQWHIATELCYNTDEDLNTRNHEREFSKILSDYMLYLLIKQPTMMSNLAGISRVRFRDTCAEAKKFFGRTEKKKNETLGDSCKKVLDVDTSAKPLFLKGDRSKSVLFDGCLLAKELQKRDDKWKMMSRVWVELLSYAAGHCGADTHAQVLSKGGELVTFVWLLMAHLGMGEHFEIDEGHSRLGV